MDIIGVRRHSGGWRSVSSNFPCDRRHANPPQQTLRNIRWFSNVASGNASGGAFNPQSQDASHGNSGGGAALVAIDCWFPPCGTTPSVLVACGLSLSLYHCLSLSLSVPVNMRLNLRRRPSERHQQHFHRQCGLGQWLWGLVRAVVRQRDWWSLGRWRPVGAYAS